VQRFAGAAVPLHAEVANANPSTRISGAKRQSANVREQNSVMRCNKYRRSSQLAKLGVDLASVAAAAARQLDLEVDWQASEMRSR